VIKGLTTTRDERHLLMRAGVRAHIVSIGRRFRTADLVSQPSDHRFRIIWRAGITDGTGVSRLGEGFLETRMGALEALGSLDCISPSWILLHITCISSQTLKYGDVGSSFDPNPRQSLFPQLISNCKQILGVFPARQLPCRPGSHDKHSYQKSGIIGYELYPSSHMTTQTPGLTLTSEHHESWATIPTVFPATKSASS
jgi:hypothetical protein